MVEDINALDLLQEEMNNDEINLKVNAIHRLRTVIMSIGAEETNRKLVDYLESKYLKYSNVFLALIKTEDDEVLFAIAEELGTCW